MVRPRLSGHDTYDYDSIDDYDIAVHLLSNYDSSAGPDFRSDPPNRWQ